MGRKVVLTQREYILSKMRQMFQLTDQEALQTYDALREEYLSSGSLTTEDQRTVIAIMKQAANIAEDIPPERVFDYRFVKQAEQEQKGWTPQVPKR